MAETIDHANQEIRLSRIEDLQSFLVHGLFVAGKTAETANKAMQRFYEQNPGRTPFSKVRRLDERRMLKRALMKARVGNYAKNTRGLQELVWSNLQLRTCSVEELEAIHGISRKTARYFLLYTRPGARVAALDTHLLKFLRVLGHDAPKATPSSLRRYEELQGIILELADQAEMSPVALDQAIWSYYATKEPLPQRVIDMLPKETTDGRVTKEAA